MLPFVQKLHIISREPLIASVAIQFNFDCPLRNPHRSCKTYLSFNPIRMMASDSSSTRAINGSVKRYVVFSYTPLDMYPIHGHLNWRLSTNSFIVPSNPRAFLQIQSPRKVPLQLKVVSLTRYYLHYSLLHLDHHLTPSTTALEHSTYAIERFMTGRTGSNLEYKHSNVSEGIQAHTSRMSEQLSRFDAVFYSKWRTLSIAAVDTDTFSLLRRIGMKQHGWRMVDSGLLAT